MPNGGSDCCGTCWFNRLNDGEPGYPSDLDAVTGRPAYCEIRELPIARPFWTYCANHPQLNSGRISTPVGPVFTAGDLADDYERRVLVASPGTEEVRVQLLALLDAMTRRSAPDYPSSLSLDAQIVDDLAALRDARAIPGLRRLIHIEPASLASDDGRRRGDALLIAHAVDALAMLAGNEALDELQWWVDQGPRQRTSGTYDPDADPAAVIRDHAVLGLASCRSPRAEALLRVASEDPNPEVAASAKRILGERSGKS